MESVGSYIEKKQRERVNNSQSSVLATVYLSELAILQGQLMDIIE